MAVSNAPKKINQEKPGAERARELPVIIPAIESGSVRNRAATIQTLN